jgi:C-terminal processing protease CtpA/Prc
MTVLAALLAALTLAAPESGVVPVSLPSPDKPPNFREGLSHSSLPTPPPRKRFFGLGIMFQNRGGAQGIALDQVVAGSPADRAGFVSGIVIVEIAGQSTLGRTAEDCTMMVREAGGKVSLKYYDPLTFKLRTRVLEKDWFPLPFPN